MQTKLCAVQAHAQFTIRVAALPGSQARWNRIGGGGTRNPI